MTMWHQDSIAIFRDEVVMGMLQRRLSRKAACNANDAIKLLLLPNGGSNKSWVGGAPKR